MVGFFPFVVYLLILGAENNGIFLGLDVYIYFRAQRYAYVLFLLQRYRHSSQLSLLLLFTCYREPSRRPGLFNQSNISVK